MTPNPFALSNPDDGDSDNEERGRERDGNENGDELDSPSGELLRELEGDDLGVTNERMGSKSSNATQRGGKEEVYHSTIGIGPDEESTNEDSHNHVPQRHNPFGETQPISTSLSTSSTTSSSSSPFVDPTQSTSQAPTPTASSYPSNPVRNRHSTSSYHRSRSDSASPPRDLMESLHNVPSETQTSETSSRAYSDVRLGSRKSIPTEPETEQGGSEISSMGQNSLNDALLEGEGYGLPLPVVTSRNGATGTGLIGGGRNLRAAGAKDLESKRSSETVRPTSAQGKASTSKAANPRLISTSRSKVFALNDSNLMDSKAEDPLSPTSSDTEHDQDQELNESLARPSRSGVRRDHHNDTSLSPSLSRSASPVISNPNERRPDPTSTSIDSGSRIDRNSKLRSKSKGKIRRSGEDRSRGGIDLDRAKKGLSGRERAMWGWVNVIDLDGFLQEVYEYYTGKGIYCIVVRRVLNLLTSGFVIMFSTFLLSCIDYSRFPSDGYGVLADVVVEHCASRWSVPHVILTWTLAIFFVWRLATFGLSVPRLLELKRFYEFLLNVPDEDIQTVSWPEIVRRISEIRQDNPTTSIRSTGDGGATASEAFLPDSEGEGFKLDAHDVANRIMRQENYLIALFNKDLLDLRVTIPLPSSLASIFPASSLLPSNESVGHTPSLVFKGTGLTQALEWNLRYCLMGELFDERGLVKKEYIRGRNRKQLVARLRRRFVFMGVLNAVFAPFIVLYFLMFSFFRYFEEYHKNPSSIGSRKYTQYARWNFREFNELPHLFDRRLDESYVMAKQYIDQFPKELTALSMRFVAFVAGAFAAVLGLLSVIDPVFLHFEITPNRTVLFYLGVFTSILAVSRGMVPPSNMVFDPELLMTEVIWYTHYMPDEWQGQLHSKSVHAEFGQLFQMKLAIFLSEVLSVLLTPFVLWFSLPRCSGEIVDFFREFTIHVDGLGYVCSFAVFDFKRKGVVKVDETLAPSQRPPTAPTTAHATGMAQARANAHARASDQTANNADSAASSPAMVKKGETGAGSLLGREGKMEKSFLHFKVTHPEWQPSDPSSSLFLSRLANDNQSTSVLASASSGSQVMDSGKESGSVVAPPTSAGYPGGTIGARSPGIDHSRERDRERFLKDKSALYEKALQRSIMLHGSGTLGSNSSGLARSKLSSRIGQLPGADRFVNSGRQGDSYHAPPHTAMQRMAMTTTMNGVMEEDEEAQQHDAVALNDLAQAEVEDGWLTKGSAVTEDQKFGVERRLLRNGVDAEERDEEEGLDLNYRKRGVRRKDDTSVMGLLKHVMGS